MAAGGGVSGPTVSVLIVAYESGPVLGRCLAALRAQTFRDFEVLLADNGSKDRAAHAEAAADPSLRFLDFGKNLGFAEANNRAAAAARGRWLALLNPDAFAATDWLERLVAAAARRPDVRCFTSLQLDDGAHGRLDGAGDVMTLPGVAYRGGYGRPRPDALSDGEVFAPCGAAMMVDRALFLDSGGFDPAYFCYCEDTDLGYRLRLRGERTLLVADAVVRHVGSSTLGARSAFALFHGARNRLWTFVKNTPPALLALTAPLHAAATLLLLLQATARREAATWRGVAAGLRGLPAVWRARRAVQAQRRVGSAAIARALTWSPAKALARDADVRP